MTAPPVFPLTVAMIEPPFEALLVPSVGASPLLAAGLFAATGTAVAVTSITVRADEEHCVTPQAGSLPENRVAMSRRHASSQGGLDNGSGFVSG